MLHRTVFRQLQAIWDPQVDKFAAKWNRQLDRFASWQHQPKAMAVDAFSLKCSLFLGYASPPIFLDSALPEQNKEGSGRDDSGSPDLASATLVPSSDESGVRAPSNFANIQRDPVESVGMPASASCQSDVVTSRLEIIWEPFKAQSLSKGVVELLLGANRNTTTAAYQSTWNGWRTWCLRQSEDLLSPGLSKVFPSVVM